MAVATFSSATFSGVPFVGGLLTLAIGILALGLGSHSLAEETPAAEPAVQEPTVQEPTVQEISALPPHDRLILESRGERQRFFYLPEDGVVAFSISGPAQVELTSRGLFNDDRQIMSYVLLYRLDGGVDQRIDVGGIDLDLGGRFSPANKGKPAHALKHRLTVGDGWHSLEVRRGSSGQPVAIKAEARPTQARAWSWQPIHPARPPSEVSIRSADGTTVSYYRFSEEQGIRIEPPGPGYLRLQVHSEHLGSQPTPFRYQIEIRRDGKPLHLYHLLGQRSSSLALVGGSANPGSLREIIFPVDPGDGRLPSHYLLRPAIGSGRTFLGRVDFSPAPSTH